MSRTVLTLALIWPFTLSASEPVLKVALFPYVPNQEGMENVAKHHWEDLHPDVRLEFVYWDCYEKDPPDDVDIFETDALFLEHLVRNNRAAKLRQEDIDTVNDIYDFALRGSMVDGTIYGIPRIACRPVLFYRKGDSDIKSAKGIGGLLKAIGVRDGSGAKPAKGEGLLISLVGGTTCACYYLDGVFDLFGNYTTSPHLPGRDRMKDAVVDNVQLLSLMAGRKQALFEDWEGQRARWFADGYGRAFVGWTERLAKIPEEKHAGICMRSLPLGPADKVNLMFVDTLCVNPLIGGRRRKLALEFANLVASREVVVDSFLVEDTDTGNPQYLLPVRKSVIDDERLLSEAPLYKDLGTLLEQSPRAFRMGVGARGWLADMKETIRRRITTPFAR